MSNSVLFYLHALSPLHMGTGASVGAIDLPHSREASTGLPNAPGSGIKGVWRDAGRALPNHSVLFGSAWDQSTNRDQGALLFSDAWLLCLPVKSFVGDFAWVTSPMTLARYARERPFCAARVVGAAPAQPGLPPIPRPLRGKALVTAGSGLVHDNKVYLHDLFLPTSQAHTGKNDAALALNPTDQWAKLIAQDVFGNAQANTDNYFYQAFIERFVVVNDADLVVLSETSADVRMRNALDENKQVRKGALWSEENMPSESIFWGSVAADTIGTQDNQTHHASANLAAFANAVGGAKTLQFGGKASVGRGVARFVIAGGAASREVQVDH